MFCVSLRKKYVFSCLWMMCPRNLSLMQLINDTVQCKYITTDFLSRKEMLDSPTQMADVSVLCNVLLHLFYLFVCNIEIQTETETVTTSICWFSSPISTTSGWRRAAVGSRELATWMSAIYLLELSPLPPLCLGRKLKKEPGDSETLHLYSHYGAPVP